MARANAHTARYKFDDYSYPKVSCATTIHALSKSFPSKLLQVLSKPSYSKMATPRRSPRIAELKSQDQQQNDKIPISPVASSTKTPITGGSRWVTPDTKGSGPFGYLADADETEEDDYLTTLIPTCRKITVQQLIDALQAAIKENPAVAAMEVVPDILNDGNNLGPYEVTIDSNVVFISSGERNPY